LKKEIAPVRELTDQIETYLTDGQELVDRYGSYAKAKGAKGLSPDQHAAIDFYQQAQLDGQVERLEGLITENREDKSALESALTHKKRMEDSAPAPADIRQDVDPTEYEDARQEVEKWGAVTARKEQLTREIDLIDKEITTVTAELDAKFDPPPADTDPNYDVYKALDDKRQELVDKYTTKDTELGNLPTPAEVTTELKAAEDAFAILEQQRTEYTEFVEANKRYLGHKAKYEASLTGLSHESLTALETDDTAVEKRLAQLDKQHTGWKRDKVRYADEDKRLEKASGDRGYDAMHKKLGQKVDRFEGWIAGLAEDVAHAQTGALKKKTGVAAKLTDHGVEVKDKYSNLESLKKEQQKISDAMGLFSDTAQSLDKGITAFKNLFGANEKADQNKPQDPLAAALGKKMTDALDSTHKLVREGFGMAERMEKTLKFYKGDGAEQTKQAANLEEMIKSHKDRSADRTPEEALVSANRLNKTTQSSAEALKAAEDADRAKLSKERQIQSNTKYRKYWV